MIPGKKYRFTQDNVDKSPDDHGVYVLYDGDEVIYIGRAVGQGVTIRSRLQSHYRGDEGSCTEGATHYRRDVRSDGKTAEANLLAAFQRRYGQLPRCNAVQP